MKYTNAYGCRAYDARQRSENTYAGLIASFILGDAFMYVNR